MKHLNQYVNWRLEDRGESKPAKVPVDLTTGHRIDPHNPAVWLSYAEAIRRDPVHVGFVLTDNDPYWCIDLDHAWNGVEWSPLVNAVLLMFPGAYVETSYSGDGLHIIATGAPPAGYSTRGPGVEFYSTQRFIAITGHHATGSPDTLHDLTSFAAFYLKPARDSGTPTEWTDGPCTGSNPITDDDELIARMLAARVSAGVAFGGKASAADLWAGNVQALADAWPSQTDAYDRSAADAALAGHLAFWTGKDCARIERLMRRSALVREKWDRRGDDYLKRSIIGAVGRVAKVYDVGAPAVLPPVCGLQAYDYAHTEDELAIRLIDALQNRGRFVASWSQWLIFDGVCWREDSTLAMFDAARRICREITDKAKIDPALTEAQRDKIVTRLKQASTFAAVERIARSDRAAVASVDQWDADPWLLNTPGGVVDLRTGEVRAQRPEDYMTKMTAVAPGGDCPTWQQFLHRVADGNADLIAYLKRLTGYALTGSTREHVLPFAHGSGGNGKGVFIGAISKMMGDYHRATPIETFAASSTDRHPTELAALRGARLVTAQETEEGRRWAESRIKSLTGGDRITARFMRQDFFEYDPQFTLLIAGNHKPGLRSVDEAIRRRFHMVPFVVTIPEAERDERLPERLRDEWAGILAWGIEGCLEWQRIGLAPPPAVTAATDAYLDGQDAVGVWLADCCDIDPNAWSITSDLYTSFRMWAERAGEFVLPRTRFTDALETRRFIPERRTIGRGTRGLRLKSPSVFAGAGHSYA